MKLATEIFDHVVVIHSPEDLSGDSAEDFEEFVATQKQNRVVLDMDNTESVDSQGLTALLNVYDALHERGGDIKIATRNTSNIKILEITRIDQQLEVYESVIDAVRSFR